MHSFFLHIPTKIYFGDDKKEEVALEISRIAKSILLVTGGNSVNKNGYLRLIKNMLEKMNITVYEYSGIEANPLSTTIDACADTYKDKPIDAVIGLGGGSVMDASKAISALLFIYKHHATSPIPKTIWPYVLGNEYAQKLPGALPLIMIPTTAATASEVTPISVISNLNPIGKSTLRYEFLKPEIAWLNPEFTKLLPMTVTRDGAADIISHVIENYLIGEGNSPMTDRYCESIIKTVVETLPKISADPFNLEHRANLLWCSSLALNGMHAVGRKPSIFPLHAIEYAMSAYKHSLSHGRGLATLFPSYFKWLWNTNRSRNRLHKLAYEIFGIQNSSGIAGLLFISHFESWLKENGLLQSCYCLGFSDTDFTMIADYAIRTYGNGHYLDVIGKINTHDITEILKNTAEQIV